MEKAMSNPSRDSHIAEPAGHPPLSSPPAGQPKGGSQDVKLLTARQIYTLTLECGEKKGCSQISCIRAGNVPGGTRLHLTYVDGKISVDEKWDEGNPLIGKSGTVLSGGDWVLVRRDGVAVFDARLTFRMNDGFVFDANIEGRAAIPSWPNLLGTMNVALPVQFEAAQLNDSWIAKKYREQAKEFSTYKDLVRNQFLAVGTIELAEDHIPSVELHFMKIRVHNPEALA